uniref:DUF7622 domain-containing protein n=1 Tax=Pristionchus pacificus TaxID=54126 RepID=A0A2A6BXF7_PRIPA|eukprot:PDM70579.1 hypothetical protein PRIPAC_46825 [Pristionchus pacificus]
MSVSLSIISLSIFPSFVLPLISCKQCKSTFGVEMCNNDCEGDICYSTDTFPSFATNLVSRSKGCVLGLAPIEMGCRNNQDGQKLCLCNSPNCNDVPENLTNFEAPMRLRARACDCVSVHPNRGNSSFLRPCAASYCTYQKTQITTNYNLSSISFSSGCSMSLDYDLFNSNSRFFYYPETCAMEEAAFGQSVTTCYTTQTDLQIEATIVPPPIDPITCYTGSSLPLGQADPFTSGNCTGQFCVLSVGKDLSVSRGCLTIMNLGPAVEQPLLTNGYYKDVNGREQWLCSGKSYCNADLTTLINSWPEELIQYKNLSLSSPSNAILPSLRQQPSIINPCTTGYITEEFTRTFILILVDMEVSELVSILGGCDHTEPVTEERNIGGENDTGLVDLDLDATDSELSILDVEDLVLNGALAFDVEFHRLLLLLEALSGLGALHLGFMDESFEEEENVFEQTTSAALHHVEDVNETAAADNNVGVPDEVDEHDDEGPGSSHYSEVSDVVSQQSPSREIPDDEIHCANCSNYRDNSVRAFDAATNVSKLQAQYNKLNNKYEELCKNNASASILIEETCTKLRETEIHRDSLQGELNTASSEIQRLQDLNKQYLEAARLTDKHRQAADSWRNKYIQSQAILLDKSQKYDALEEKYRNSVDIVKSTLGISNENAKKVLSLQDKMAQKTSDIRVMKKSWNPVVRLIADISSQLSEQLPDGFRERLNRLPIDELLQIAKPQDSSRGAEDSDDDDAEAIQRLMNSDSHDAQSEPYISAHSYDARGGRANRVSRGGRAQSISTRRGGNKFVDETMHEKLLSRKLHKDDSQHNTIAFSNPSAKSVMGKKTETVREQQERQKAGLKDKIAEMKKNAAAANEQSKGPILSASDHEDDTLMSDHEADNSSAVISAPLEFDLDMPDFGDLDVNKSDGVCVTGIMDKSPSPAKMIKHPKVVELSQDRATMGVLCDEISSKRDQRRQESLTALGMDMSDSDDSEDDNDKRTELTDQSEAVSTHAIPSSNEKESISSTSIQPVDSSLIDDILSGAHRTSTLRNTLVTKSMLSPPEKSKIHALNKRVIPSMPSVGDESAMKEAEEPRIVLRRSTRARSNALSSPSPSSSKKRRMESNERSDEKRNCPPAKIATVEMQSDATEPTELSPVCRRTRSKSIVRDVHEASNSEKTRQNNASSATRRPPSSTKAEAVPRKQPQGAQQIGAVKQTAARLRDEHARTRAALSSSSFSTEATKRVMKVAAAPDDVTPFSRNSRRTAVAAPRARAPAVSTSDREGNDDTCDDNSHPDDASPLEEDSMPEPVRNDEASLMSGVARKRIARMGSAGDLPIAVTAPSSSCGIEDVNEPASLLDLLQMSSSDYEDDDNEQMNIDDHDEKDDAPPIVTPVIPLPDSTMEGEVRSLITSPSTLSNSQPLCERSGEEAIQSNDSVLDEGKDVPVDSLDAYKSIKKPQEDDEMEPGSCIIEDDAEDKEVMCREGFEERPVSSCNNEEGDLIIDSGPNSPAITPPPPPPTLSPIISIPPTTTAAASQENQSQKISASQVPSQTQSLEEKRRNAIAALNANRVRANARGGGMGGITRPGGEMHMRATNSPRLSTISGNGSRTSVMEAKMAKMSKNLSSGKLAMSGKVRPSQPVSAAVPPHRAGIAVKNQLSALPSQQYGPSSCVKGTVETTVVRAKVIPQNKIGEQRPLKRKANLMSCSVDAVAIRATDVRTRGGGQTVPAPPPESVEKAIQNIDISMLRVETIVKCICRALMELPQANNWYVVRSSMSMKIETIDRNKVIPKPERNLFDLLMKMHENGNSMMSALFDIFFETYSRVVLRSICSSNTTADVTRHVRCLFFALVLTHSSLFRDLKRKRWKKDEGCSSKFSKSSRPKLSAKVFLLWQKDTASLVSDILRTELSDDSNGGRLISMHMNAKKEAEILYWSIEQFANNSCKNLSTAAFKTPATLEMVQRWWAADMGAVEAIKDKSDSICYTSTGALKVDRFYKELMMRMAVLISPQLKVNGLDRVKLLEQLDTPALDAVDRVTANRIEDTGRVSLFTDTSAVSRAFLEAGEARVTVVKMHIAMAALTSFYTDQMYEADQREALRLHLALSIERNYLSMGVRALMKWRDVVQRLTLNDLKCTPVNISTDSTPITKRPRCEDNDTSEQPSALMELPQANNWYVVRSSMSMKIETIDRNKVIPKPERNLFDLLMKMHENGNSMMSALFDIFFEYDFCSKNILSRRSSLHLFKQHDGRCDETCPMFVLRPRPHSCQFFFIFYFFTWFDNGKQSFGIFSSLRRFNNSNDLFEVASSLFRDLKRKRWKKDEGCSSKFSKSSRPKLSAKVFLLWQKDTASLVSDILRTELSDDSNGGRLISMHMNAKKEAEILYWSIEQFANNSCKNLSTAAFKTPATLEMVQRWWAADMGAVEAIKDKSDSICYTSTGALKVDRFYKELMMRMAVLISPQLKVNGLDRVKLLEQLDTPALDAVDRVTANRIEDTGRVCDPNVHFFVVSLFTDTSAVSRAFLEAGEARVTVVKMHIAMAALTSFYTDR